MSSPLISRRLRSQCGIAVLEALIAFSLLAVSALAVIHIQTDLRYSAALSQQRLQASRLAQQQIENWRFTPTTLDAKTVQITRDTFSDAATHYRIKRQVSLRTSPVLAEISVQLEWKDQRQQAQQWQVHTLQSTIDAVYSGALALK